MEKLKANNITISYNGENTIEDINIHLDEGEIVSLLGVSGSGKTTLFNILSGLMIPDCGEVLLDGENITGKPGKLSYMLQKDLLLPHYTVLDNVALPLIIKGEKKSEAREKALKHLSFFGLDGTENTYQPNLEGKIITPSPVAKLTASDYHTVFIYNSDGTADGVLHLIYYGLEYAV